MKIIHFPPATGLLPRQADSFDFAASKLYRLERAEQWSKLIAYENELRLNGWTADEIDHGRSCGKMLARCKIVDTTI